MSDLSEQHADYIAQIKKAFERAAATYKDNAALQHEISLRLIERLQYIKLQPQNILDIGAGTGFLTHGLRAHYPKAQIFALDLAESMLATLNKKRWLRRKPLAVCADAQQLPFQDHSFDMVMSNFALQWCVDLDHVFQEIARVLKPNGLFMFTSFGPDTLKELRQSWASLDNEQHVNTFIDMHDLGDALLRAGFADPVMDVEHVVCTYSDVRALLKELKGIGANTVLGESRRSLTGRQRFAAMQQAYEVYRQADGVLPATYEVVYGHGWGVERARGETTVNYVPLEQVQGVAKFK